MPTAAAGLSDWADVGGDSRRVATVHARGNTTALVVQTLSWQARRRGDRGRGVALSLVGYGIATVSAWLGGHLSFAKGVGVNQTAFDPCPGEWTPLLGEDELEEGKLAKAQADGVGVLLVRTGGRVHALANRCSHRGCSLHKGKLSGDRVTCPCHGSTLRPDDGGVVKRPATSPQLAFEVRTHNGMIEIRRSQGRA